MSQRRQVEAPSATAGGRWQWIGGWAALVFLACGSLLILDPLRGVALAGVGQSAAPESGTSGLLASGAVIEAGRGLYQAQCASCHGVNGEGTDLAPSLVGAGAAAADFYLRTGRMPLAAPDQPVTRHDPIFSNAEIAAITSVVASFGPGPEIPQVQGGGDVGEGAELYIANCAACHGATGSGNAIGGGAIAASLGQADPTEIVEAMRIGPGAMPRFGFSEEQESSIVAYVDHLQERANPGGLAIGGFGAVAEGFVAVSIGLVLLVLVAMFVGRRSHEGEPPTTPVG